MATPAIAEIEVSETNRIKSKGWIKPLVLWFVGFVLIAAVCFVCVAWFRVDSQDSAARKEIQKRLEAIRLAGQPLNMQDLARLYTDPPPSQDAALLLKPALALVVMPKDSTNVPFYGGEFPSGNVPLQQPAFDEITAVVEKNQAAIDAVPWDKLQGTWIGSGFQNGFTNLTQAPISKISALTRILCLKAALLAEGQHPAEAAQLLQHALEIGQTLRNDTLLHGLERQVIDRWVCISLNRVLDRTALADSDLANLSAHLSRTNFGATKELLLNLRADQLAIAEYVQSIAAASGRTRSISPVRRFLRSYQSKLIYRDQDLLDYLDTAEAGFSALDLPVSNAIPTLFNLEKKSKMAEDAFTKDPGPAFLRPFRKHRASILSMTTPPDIYPLYTGEAQTVAYVRATRTGIAIERWRLSHDGDLPESLSTLPPELLPSVPIDPFDEKPLRYRKLGTGYIIYSIGTDFKDDGGKRGDVFENEAGNYDIVFSVAR